MAGDIKIDLQGISGLVTGGASAIKTIVETFKGKSTLSAEDVVKLEEIQADLEKASLAAESAAVVAVQEVNKTEAASPRLFVSGWRPFIGWACGAGIFAYYPVKITVGMVFWCWACFKVGGLVTMPDLGIMDLLGLTGTMLGMGYLRSKDKAAGVAS